MSKAKKRILIIVIVALVIAIAAVWFSGRKTDVQEHQPGSIVESTEHSQQTEEVVPQPVTLTAEEWKEILLSAIDCDGEEAEWLIEDDGSMTVKGKLPKSTIQTWMEEAGESSGMYSSILSIMPKAIPMTLNCAVSCENGDVKLDLQSLSASGIEVPKDVVSGGIWNSVNRSINESLHGKIDSISSIDFAEDAVTLNP